MWQSPITPSILSGLFAFLGVILAQVVVIWSQRRKTLDEDSRRWLTERRVLYAKLLAESNLLQSRFDEALAENDPTKLPNIYDDNDYLVEQTLNEIRLIGSDEVVEEANSLGAAILVRTIATWRYAIHGSLEEMDNEERVRYSKPHRESTKHFLEAARAELVTPARNKQRKCLSTPKERSEL